MSKAANKAPNGAARAVAYEVALSAVEYQTDVTRRLERRLRMRLQPQPPTALIWPGRDGQRRGGPRTTIFGQSARVVVVLYTPAWDKAPATADDRAAIKRRMAAEGTGAVRVIMLEGGSPPAWLRAAPRRSVGEDVEACAEWIADAVQEAGGRRREPTTVDTAPRVSAEDQLAQDRDTFLGSHRAIAHLAREFDRLTSEVAHRVETVVPVNGTTPEVHRAPGRCTVQLGPVALSLSWVRTRPDLVSTGRLMIIEWEGTIGGGSALGDGRPRAVPLREDVLRVEATRAEDWRWRSEDGAARGWDSHALAERCVASLTKALRSRAR